MSKGKDKSTPTSPYEESAAQMAQQLFAQTSPLREQLVGDMGSFLQGGYNPRNLPAYQPLYAAARTGPESQYNVARENILSNTARGGGQTQALANLEQNRAVQTGNMESLITQDLLGDILGKAYGAAFQTPQVSIGGTGSAASSYAARQAALSQSQGTQKGGFYGMMGGLGQGAGSYLGGK